VSYVDVNELVVYHTTWSIAAAAIAVSILGVVSTLPLYWGWWRLGRSVTLSPLEIAKAFGAPLLSGVNSNATAEEMAMQTGNLAVRYGTVKVSPDARDLSVAVDDPEGEVHETNDTDEECLEDSRGGKKRMQLCIDHIMTVEPPLKGMQFV
jgi:hypothetical protein